MKNKTRTNGDKADTNCCGLNVPRDSVECEPFVTMSIDVLLVYKRKYYQQVYLGKCD